MGRILCTSLVTSQILCTCLMKKKWPVNMCANVLTINVNQSSNWVHFVGILVLNLFLCMNCLKKCDLSEHKCHQNLCNRRNFPDSLYSFKCTVTLQNSVILSWIVYGLCGCYIFKSFSINKECSWHLFIVSFHCSTKSCNSVALVSSTPLSN